MTNPTCGVNYCDEPASVYVKRLWAWYCPEHLALYNKRRSAEVAMAIAIREQEDRRDREAREEWERDQRGEVFDTDGTVEHCEACGALTGNEHGLCTRCTGWVDDYDEDRGRLVGFDAWRHG